MNRTRVFACIGVLFALSIVVNTAFAEIPRMISYQGRVFDGVAPVSDGSYSMEFKLFNAESGGTQRWESGSVSVQVTNGVFSVILGESPQSLQYNV